MNRLIRSFLTAACLLSGAAALFAQPLPLPLEIHQDLTLYNLRSQRGVPISTVSNVPPGSGGRMTIANQSAGSVNLPTTNQFKGFLSFGGLPGLRSNVWSQLNTYTDLVNGTGPFSPTLATEMGLPRGYATPGDNSSTLVMVVRRAQVGMPFISRQISFAFGSEIAAPTTDERGLLLTNALNTAYWLTQPYLTTNGSDVAQGFYWSPNAQKVFAIQSGPVKVTWVKAAGYSISTLPAYTNLNGAVSFQTNGGTVYALYTANYLVSGSSVKTPQRMYWTEKPFNNSGQLVSVPQGSVAAVNVLYNNNFPEKTATPYIDPYTPPPVDPTNSFQELRTLWYENNVIHAFNVEGRAFVELLGELNSDNSRRFLGFEIVDVFREPFPADVTVDLGERVPAYQDGRDDSNLYPSPLLNTPQKFYYRQGQANSDQVTLYATYQTANLNDFQSYWLIPGVAGLRWPYLFNRYHEVWPADVSRYSHYLRTLVATEAEAATTAVQLPGNEAPQMPYQDPLPAPLGATLQPSGLFYTFLDQNHPAHRTLLQFNSGNNVAFERVFSWLDLNLKSTNFTDTLATNLTATVAYRIASSNYVVAYSNYLQALPRAVNGNWYLFAATSDSSPLSFGSAAPCAVMVESVSPGGALATNEFAGPVVTNIFTASPITVTGITNAVTAVRLKFKGLSCNNAASLGLFVQSPDLGFAACMNYGDGRPGPITNLDLFFDDRATTSIPIDLTLNGLPLVSGIYESDDSIMVNLLLPAPTPPAAPTPWPDEFAAPRIVKATVDVGDRIVAPGGELGNTGNYLAGYILQTNGISFNPRAYRDPFVVGFSQANQGAIIPVNAIPGQNTLEVWWFRKDNADQSRGFQPVYWPAVIGHYTLRWPANADEIVLASNDGSGPLDSLQAKGSIYRQPDPTQPGYNPNEEHALMLGGQAYALSDDLNNTNAGPNYSSAPYVLLDYSGPDSRPAMRAFHVRREAPERGILFDYIVDAGSVLQAPMPLPLLAPPVLGTGQYAVNFNTAPSTTSSNLPVGWNSSFAQSQFSHYAGFVFEDRKHDFWVYRGLHAGLPRLQIGAYNPTSNSFDPLPAATAVVNQPFTYYLQASRRLDSLTMSAANLPSGLTLALATNGWTITGIPNVVVSNVYSILTLDGGDNSLVTNTVSINVVASGTLVAQDALSITSTNQYSGAMVTYKDRPPFLAQPPTPTNSFTMRFYYLTDASFDWPGVANPPAAGTIVPYLLPLNALGRPSGTATSRDTPSLDIVYRPVWPSLVNGQPLPTLFSGETLTVPKRGMAAIRGQSSLQTLYQQSVGLDITNAPATVVLHDPTVQKTASWTSPLPASVIAKSYLGKYYFPNLPPNLVNRVLYDPNTKNLVLKGQFVDEPVGEKYLFLNVLRDADLAAVKGLCPSADTANKSAWDTLVDQLSTPVYTFHEDPNTPGSYVADPNATVTIAVTNLVEITNSDTQVDSYALGATGPGSGYVTYIAGNGHNPTHAGEPVSVYIIRVAPPLYPGQLKVIPDPNPLSESISFQHTADLAGRSGEYQYDWRIAPPVDGQPPVSDPTNWTALVSGRNLDHYTMGGAAGIQSLSDNYIALRYRSVNPLAPPALTNWSTWTQPQLAEGWIKRVLAGINPFNQRTSDLFNNPANTTANIISQAGHRWEGDVALNLDTLNSYGLIEIYETILNRGKAISINAPGGINFGPANDALLLAAGYLNDLYMFIGNDAWADAANPTIGIGTADRTYGNIATALFAFKGQEASLLDEEQALLRGRDDFLAPGVGLNPVYNRLFWNYTRGIDAGEVIYALNYNILDQNNDGVVNAADAAILYPQGHGDAYGHYLTALSGYYSLLMNPNFDWVPRIEAVTVLGATVSVDYQDERKFATAAAALARTGRQIFDLEWRRDYQPGTGRGWGYFSATRPNPQHTYGDAGTPRPVTRYWGMDHWAARVSQGAYVDWVVGNAILPPVDPDPTHEGIQKVDRTTVPELSELPATADLVQNDLDNAEAGFTPLGLSQNSIPFDINPLQVTGTNPKTHFEQVYDRAVGTLNNAVVAFNDAQNVTQLMRSEEDSLANLQAATTNQELAYINQLIELYGTPYPDDMGPGKTFAQDYAGPDLIHYTYVENPDTNFIAVIPDPTIANTFYVDVQNLPSQWSTEMLTNLGLVASTDPRWQTNKALSIPFNIGPNGFFDKPANWTSQRASPGKIQQAISELIAAQNKFRKAVAYETYDKQSLDKAYFAFLAQMAFETNNTTLANGDLDLQIAINDLQKNYGIADRTLTAIAGALTDAITLIGLSPSTLIFGLADGGDEPKAAYLPLAISLFVAKQAVVASDVIALSIAAGQITDKQNQILTDNKTIANSQLDQDLKSGIMALGNQELNIQGDLFTINEALRSLDDAQRAYLALVAKGNRILQERLTFRQHAAALVQGYRTRDAAFRIFQNEKLERYKTLFDLAAKYAFLAAQAYDYETGLLNTEQGKAFLNRIISSRALGVVQNGQPQYAGSDTGDPGLSSALAEMKADWDVLKGRLGFNNPDGYGTTVSLRKENYRILGGADGDSNWKDVLQRSQMTDLLADPDVKRSCLQIDDGSGQPVPGIVLTFSTVISDGLNLFGQPLGPGDHNYSSSSFATKIFAAGVDFDGYIGMDNPTPGTTAGGSSPPDPSLDPNALAATPYVYLIAVGADSMRSPPLGDTSAIRSWNVNDLTIPLPFNISASDFSSNPFYLSSDSLSEPLFSVRKNQAFRPVSTTDAFSTSIYGANGALQPSQYTNKRLIGRSVWNSQWKLVIPGKTLLNNPSEGLNRFVRSVKDIKLYFVTYSYAGN